MVYLNKFLWAIALILVGCYGVTLSFSLLAVSATCVAIAGLSTALLRDSEGTRWSKLDLVVASALAYFTWRIVTSSVWDLAKEDLLLMAIALVIYLSFRIVPMAKWSLGVVASLAGLNLLAFGLQSFGVDLWIPLESVSELSSMTPNWGGFQDYGALGSSLAVSGVLFLSYGLWSGEKKTYRIAFLVFAVVSLGAVFFTGSRSASISVISGVAVLALLSWFKASEIKVEYIGRVRALLCGLACIITVLFVFLGLAAFKGRDAKFSAAGVATETNIRSDYWGMAFDQSMDAPAIGTGARSYSYECLKHWEGSLGSNAANPEFVHNEYLQTLCDYGAIGLTLLLVVLMTHWSSAVYRIIVNPVCRNDWVAVAGVVGLSVIMMHAVTDFPQRLPWNMTLGAICLAMCVPRKQITEDSDREGRKDKVLAVVLISLSVGVVIFSGKEVWASAPLLEVQQAREDGKWSAVGHEGALVAYELANDRSPDFRRTQRAGQIYHLIYEKGDKAVFGRSVDFYKKSIERNPYNPVPLMNLANLYREEGKYIEAESYYDRAKPYVVARDWYFKYYFNRAQNKIAHAEKLYISGELEEAGKTLKVATSLLKLGKSSASERQFLERDCYIARIRIAIEQANYSYAHQLWNECCGNVRPWFMVQNDAKVYGVIAGFYFEAASREWLARQPEQAKELYTRSQHFYRTDRNTRKEEPDAIRDTNLEFIERALKTLKNGGY